MCKTVWRGITAFHLTINQKPQKQSKRIKASSYNTYIDTTCAFRIGPNIALPFPSWWAWVPMSFGTLQVRNSSMQCSSTSSTRSKHPIHLPVIEWLTYFENIAPAGRPEVDVGTTFSNAWADLWNEGPELSDNTTYYWRTGGRGGLTLDLLNLLDDGWQGEYDIAVMDWEQGDPDVLTLRSEVGVNGMPCDMAFGVMKVCNNNYGDTGWLGINEIVIGGSNQKTIESSLAKMNDYYLAKADLEERRYTSKSKEWLWMLKPLAVLGTLSHCLTLSVFYSLAIAL